MVSQSLVAAALEAEREQISLCKIAHPLQVRHLPGRGQAVHGHGVCAGRRAVRAPAGGRAVQRGGGALLRRLRDFGAGPPASPRHRVQVPTVLLTEAEACYCAAEITALLRVGFTDSSSSFSCRSADGCMCCAPLSVLQLYKWSALAQMNAGALPHQQSHNFTESDDPLRRRNLQHDEAESWATAQGPAG